MKQNNFSALILFAFISTFIFSSCKKDKPAPAPTPAIPQLIFKFKFDSTQVRLNNLGAVSTIPAGHSAQSPVFNKMSGHYIELTPTAYTAVGAGDVIYHAPETTSGGSTAIDFSKSSIVGQNETFFSIPLSSVTPGTYQYLRVSLAYQNYTIKYKSNSIYGTGTIASFVGYNTYITNFNINTQNLVVNGNRAQGYWAFETQVLGNYYTTSGQAPAGSTTVVNPLSSTSPIPPGSCLATGAFATPLQITGSETHDITIVVSLSTNKSFEWKDANMDGLYEPTAGDTVVDMGIRGLIPIVQ